MNIDTILNDLFSRRTRGIKPGLERMFSAAKELGNPQDACKVVHIAGTNGKGSTASIIAAGLRESSAKVGLFTSPHILEFRERFIVDGTPVSNESWIAVWNDIQPLCDKYELTFFEISALLAFELFKRETCDYVVLETGLGGRLDATNICTPELSVITALSVEHTEYLGDTIEEIATEKLGIVKEGRPLVINGDNLPHIVELAKEICSERNCDCTVAPSVELPHIRTENGLQYFMYSGRILELPLLGEFQIQNCAVAVKALEQLGLDSETIRTGVTKTFIPCRLQAMNVDGKPFLFDVAHNPQAIQILCDSLPSDIPIHFLIGMMKDKDVTEMVRPITKRAESITVVQPLIPRAMTQAELAETVRFVGDVTVHSDQSFADSVKMFSRNQGLLVVTGSFFTVAEALECLNISPYEKR